MNYKRGSGNYKSSFLQAVVKQTDQLVNNSETFVNDLELFVPLRINKSYHFELTLLYSPKVTSDFKYTFTIPSGASGLLCNEFPHPQDDQTTSDITNTFAIACATHSTITQVVGTVSVGSTEGNFQFQFAQNNATTEDTTVLKGSMLMVYEG